MNSTIFFSVCSLFYCALLIIVTFMNKDKSDNQNKMMKMLLIVNLFGLLLEVTGLFLGNNYKTHQLLNDIVLKLMLVYHLLWVTLFVAYVIVISKIDNKKIKKYFIIITVVFLISLAYDLTLPLYYNVKNEVIIYSSGPAINFIYNYSLGCSLVSLFIMFRYFKKGQTFKYAPLFAFISLGAVVSMIQSSNPQLLLSVSMQTFVTYLIFFTTNRALISNENTGKEHK